MLKPKEMWAKSPRWLRATIILFSILVISDWDVQQYQYNSNSQSTKKYPTLFGGFISDVVGAGWGFIERYHEPLLALFTILLAVFTFLLWLVTARIARDTKISSQQTISTMEDTAKIELRAYLGLESMHFPYTSNPLDPSDRTNMRTDARHLPRIRIRNFGKTAAHGVTVRINGQWTVMNAVFDKTYEDRNYQAPVLMLAPTQAYGVWSHLQGGMTVNPYSDPPYDPNKKLLAVYGAAIYEDIYERWWVTRFCQIYDGTNRFIPYTDYNREDEYKSRNEALASLEYA